MPLVRATHPHGGSVFSAYRSSSPGRHGSPATLLANRASRVASRNHLPSRATYNAGMDVGSDLLSREGTLR